MLLRTDRPPTRAFAAIAVAAVLVSACSGGAADPDGEATAGATTGEGATDTVEPSSDPTPSTDTPSTPTASPTATPSPETTSAPGSSVEEEVVALLSRSATAMADVTSSRTRFTSTTATPEGDVTIVGEGVQAGADVDTTLTFSGDAAEGPTGEAMGEIRVIVLDGIVYQRFPLLTEQLGVDAEWVAYDLEALGADVAGLLESAESADPATALEVLRSYDRGIVVGREEVNGVDTTHVVVTVDLRTALEVQGLDGTNLTEGVDLDEPVDHDLWIDDDGLLRRLSVQVEADGASTALVIDALAYDVDVDIEAPPAASTISFDELLGG